MPCLQQIVLFTRISVLIKLVRSYFIGAGCFLKMYKMFLRKKVNAIVCVWQYVKRDSIPETIQYGRLLKELQKEVKHLTVSSMPFRGPLGMWGAIGSWLEHRILVQEDRGSSPLAAVLKQFCSPGYRQWVMISYFIIYFIN